jgi:cell wall-associated NlpC family hydrolase
VTVLSAAAAATAALSGGAAPFAAADPAGGPGTTGVTGSASRIDDLYQQAEAATQAYDAAQETGQRLRAELSTLQDRAARTQARVNELRDQIGLLAASQYRGGGIDPSLGLLLSDDPDGYLDRLSVLDRIDGQQAGRLRELRAAERALHQQRVQAAGRLTELERAGAVLRQRKQAVQQALASAQRLLRAMPPAVRAAWRPGEGERASRDRTPGLPGLSAPALPAPTGRAALAVAAARSVLGSPYVWGATGPNAFDCSGLMVYAYRQAGVALPRTSQEQMNAGRHVPLDEIRPGDLVIYRADASHVAMYVGGGMVIHAPYPGARVRYDPIGMMPVTAVTRP